MGTRRLYHEDPDRLRFEAEVRRVEVRPDGAAEVELDATAFYPTGGGQPHDVGSLGEGEVVDVVEDGERVVHVVRGTPPAGRVTGIVDEARRTDHRQQHTGQHILSRAFEELGARTIGFHLGAERSTIDLDRDDVDDEFVRRAEDRANRVVLSDVPVGVSLHEDESTVPAGLRNALPPERPIRLVAVGEFDTNPCCGTHCTRSGQVGPIRVLRTERNKGGTRVEFVCGHRALDDHARRVALLRELALELTTEEGDLPERLRALRAEARRVRSRLEKTEEELRGHVAAAWAAEAAGAGFVHRELPAERSHWLAPLASDLAGRTGRPVLLSAEGADGIDVALACPAGTEPGAGERLRAGLEVVGGRGGGSKELARGRVPLGELPRLRDSLERSGGN